MHKRFLSLAVLILLVAAALRLYELDTYPPGPHYDEAANILIARSIAFDGAALFPIANSYQGRETLYHYFSTPVLQHVIDNRYAFQLVSVFSNLLTISASMALGRAMFRGRRGIVIGLIVGALMAISFHQIFMSRQAYRAVTLPLMQALGLLFLWRGLTVKRRAWLWLIVGGVFSGGALYTYMASRLFPLWLLLGGLLLMMIDRNGWKRRLGQGLIFFAALGIAALPMVVYALQNPDIFFQRLSEVSEGETTVTLAESIRLHLEMFFIRGDFGNLRYNIPGRPYFTPLEGVLLMVGVLVAFWRLFQPLRPAERVACFMALISPLMVIPSVVSLGGLPPSHMRSLGMVPLIFVLVAIGAEAVFRRVSDGLMRRGVNPRYASAALPVMIAAVLSIGGGFVADAYFTWARRADLFYQADGDLAAAVEWLPEHTGPDDLVYIAAFHREHPTVIASWQSPVTWLGGDSLFLPPPGQQALVIFAHEMPPSADWQAILQPYQLTEVPTGPDGGPAFWAYRLDGDAPPAQAARAATSIHTPLMTFLGMQAAPIAAGESGEITMMWRIDQPPPYYRLRPILDLHNAQGIPLASSDAFLLGTNNWRPGEVMYQRMRVNVPPGTPPGEYPLHVTWVDRDTETYVSYLDEEGAYAGISAEIGSLSVIRPEVFAPPEALDIPLVLNADVAPGVRFLGWEQWDKAVRPGETLTLKTHWQAIPTDSRREDLRIEARLQGNDPDDVAILYSGLLAYSPQLWAEDEIVTVYMQWQIPREQTSGGYTLLMQAGETAFVNNHLEIAGNPRIFSPIPVQEITNSLFSDELTLHGYTLRKDNGIQLELVWRAEKAIEQNYTVFIHVIDKSGQIIAQQDMMPKNNTYPTALWLPGEYVQDKYTFDGLLLDDYTLRVGLYLQENGVRLPVWDVNKGLAADYIEISSANANS